MRVLVILVDKKQKNLGGQERRWMRVANHLKTNYREIFDFAINNSSYDMSHATDSPSPESAFRLRDFSNVYLDYLYKNLMSISLARGYGRIHFSNQSVYLIPAIAFIKLVLRKTVSISYNGTSLDVHKRRTGISYYDKVRFLHRLVDKTEVLNPLLLRESWIQPGKVHVAPCSFSDRERFKPGKKIKKIVFAGHFYEGKGVDLLRRILMASQSEEFAISIYGDSVEGDESSKDFKRWLLKYSLAHPHIRVEHKKNMAGAYSDATVFLSLQQISNYPSQSVIEALYSGCGIVMTRTGDSELFGRPSYIRYIDPTDTIDSIWSCITNVNQISMACASDIASASKKRHSLELYIEFIRNFLK
jgi:glycosyltransferase involved in cell wall biosynthesis